MKKIFKILVGIIVLMLIALILIPVIFEDKIIGLLKEKINNNINAKVEFVDADLSLFRNFPNASVKLNDISVVNFEPFKGDTLFSGKEVTVALKITDLFKKVSEELTIQSFTINNAKVAVLVNKNGQANYNIAKKTTEKNSEKSADEKKPMKLAIKSYKITNTNIKYEDKKSKTFLTLANFNHSGSGDLSTNKTQLDTQTSANVSFTLDKSNYLNNQYLDLKALLDLDLENNKFSFLKNEAHINQLPLTFNGFIKLNDNNQEVNVNFKTPSSNFKNFLALIPKQYAKNIEDVKTTGNFSVTGKINGIIDDNYIPKIDIAIKSNNASFKFPSLPKSVQNILIDASIKNTDGIVKNTIVTVNNLSFKIDDNKFSGNALISQLTTNPRINASVKGKLNLADIDKVYPLETANKLSGLINADLTSQFDMEAIKNNNYTRIKNNGNVSIDNFVYESKDIVNPFHVKNAQIAFNPGIISLKNLNAKTGTTDINATGKIDNLLGFLLSDKKLSGSFKMNANEFRVSDFMKDNDEAPSKESEEKNPQEKTLKIPEFLDVTLYANAKKVYYDTVELNNVTGTLILKDEKAVLKDVNANMFDGKIALNGAVNTQQETPLFDMKMGLKSVDISQSISNLKMFEMLAPVANVLQGKLNTTIDLKGDLKNDFTPNLTSIGGNAFAQVLTERLNPEKSKAMSLLSSQLNFIDFKKLNLNDIKTRLDFKDGKVNVQPFAINYKDIAINIGGSHGLDKSMNYNVTFNVPAKYLGSDITKLLSKLDANAQNMTIPVVANLTGSFNNPSVSTDLQSAVTNLTNQLIKKQKDNLINTTLNGLLGGNKTKKDTTKTSGKKEDLTKQIGNILGGFLGGKKKDTTKQK